MRTRVAVSTLFLVHGLVEATWVSRIPEIQSKLHADTGVFGMALLGSAAGAIVSMPATGWLLSRRNTRTVTMIVTLAHCASLPLLAAAPSALFLLLALMLYGAAGGAADVAINAEGSAVDRRSVRPVMSSFHALFSMGGMVGAGLGAAAVKFEVPIWRHFAVAAAIYAGASWWAARTLSPQALEPRGRARGRGFALPPRALLGLGMLAFCILFGERAMADWTGIYLVGAGASASFAAYGYAAFSGAMTTGRFCGDFLIHHLGAAKVVRAGSAVASIGLAVSLAIGTPASGLFGFAMVGLGFSVVVPILFRAGGRTVGVTPGVGIAAVTTMGYLGFLLGPPIVGFTARVATLRVALLLVALLSAVVSVVSRRVNLGSSVAE